MLNFVDGWVYGLNQRGDRAAVTASLCSGILDLATVYGIPQFRILNAVWIAAWNNTPNIYGFGLRGRCPMRNGRTTSGCTSTPVRTTRRTAV